MNDALAGQELGDAGATRGGAAAIKRFMSAASEVAKSHDGDKGLQKLFQGLVKAVRKHDQLNSGKAASLSTPPTGKVAVKQPSATATKRNGRKKWVHNPKLWHGSDRACGISDKHRQLLETTMGCSEKYPIQVQYGAYNNRHNMKNVLTYIFKFWRTLFSILGITEESLPSQHCCMKYTDDQCSTDMSCGIKGSGNAGSVATWHKYVVEACCGKTPASRCDLKNKSGTCMPLLKTEPYETPRDKSWNLKCRMRAQDKPPIAEAAEDSSFQLDSVFELGDGDALSASGRWRRRRHRRHHHRRHRHRRHRHRRRVWGSTIRKVAGGIRGRIQQAVKKAVDKMKKKVMKDMIPQALKFIIKKASPRFRPFFRAIGPYLTKGEWKNAMLVALLQFRALLLEPILKKFKLTNLYVECAIRENLLLIANQKYHTSVELAPLDTKSPGCKGNSKSDAKGPLLLNISRIYRGKAACSFTMGVDAYSCQYNQYNCCEGWSWSFPKFSSSDFKPQKQLSGHGCKAWYLSVMNWANAVVGIIKFMGNLKQRRNCLKSGCSSTDNCSKSKCNATQGCKYNPLGKVDRYQQRPGICQPNRV